MIKEDKRGQFYLLAAIVIIVVIVSFAAISNYTSKQSSIKLYDVKDELGIESGKVLDFGTIDETVSDDVLLGHFTTVYDDYAGEGKDIYFIFGNEEGLLAYSYTEEVIGEISLTFGEGDPTNLNILERQKQNLPYTTSEGIVIVTIEDNEYEFELKPGQNFYFVISQQIGEEQVVVTS